MEQNQQFKKDFVEQLHKLYWDRQLAPADKLEQYLSLKEQIVQLPQRAKHAVTAEVNSEICLLYIKLHKRYLLTPLVAEIFESLSFWEQNAQSNGEIGQILVMYQRLADICGAKNHQRDVARCCQAIAKLCNRVGERQAEARATARYNIALSKIPNTPFDDCDKVAEVFDDCREQVEKIFGEYRGLKNDPVEQSEKYIAIYDEAERLIQQQIDAEDRLVRVPEQYFNTKKRILKEKFGIEWKSPRELNRRVIF